MKFANRWRAALRIARRDAWKHRARSLLVIALVGLPVLVLSTIAVLYRSYQIGPGEQVTRVMGSSDAWLEWYGADHIQQEPDAPWTGGVSFDGKADRPRATPTDAQVLAQLPHGSRIIGYRYTDFGPSYYTAAGLSTASALGLDYTDPLARGMVEQRSGRAPRTAAEADISPELAAASGLGVGATLRLAEPARSFTIVGIARQRQAIRDQTIFTLPAAAPIQQGTDFSVQPGRIGWLADTPAPVSWSQVRQLNSAGFVTLSRHVYLDPPPVSQQPLYGGGSDSSPDGQVIASVSLIAGMALLEVVLLAGPAFAVGARRRQRDLALVAASGGSRRDLRRIVLADAVVLGLSAGVIAVGLGIAAAALAGPWLESFENHLPGPFSIPVLQLAALVGLSMLTAVLAALMPAVRAARVDVVAALAGRRGTLRSSRRWPILGAALIGLGVLLTLGSIVRSSATTIVFGVGLVELGVVCCTPTVIGVVSRGARWLPLSGRIALRDAGRNRAAISPAVAAVMAAVIGAVALAIAAASSTELDRSRYAASLPQRDALVSLYGQPRSAGTVLAAVDAAMPGRRAVVVRGWDELCEVSTSGDCAEASVTGSTTTQFALPAVVIDDGAATAALFGRQEPAAVAALRAGRAVVTGTLRQSASARLDLDIDGSGDGGTGSSTRHVTFPATRVHVDGYVGPQVIMPSSLAKRLSFDSVPVGVLVPSAHGFTVAEQQKLALALTATGRSLQVTYETGFRDGRSWIWVTLIGAAAFVAVFAALIATALANIDGRADLMTLGAVGASPRTRRVLSMSRAAVIAGLGALTGTAAGLLPAAAWVRAINAPVVLPWPALVLTVLGVPLVTALLAGAFTSTRSRT